MENIKWLWGVMDKRYHKWHILGLIIRHADGAGARLAECGGVAILKVDGDGGLRGFFRCGEAGQKQAECHQQKKRLCDPVFHV